MESTAAAKTQCATDGTVTQLLQSVNEVENRVRIVGGQLAEETTRRDAMQHEERRLKAEVAHLAQREKDLQQRLEAAASEGKRLTEQSAAVEKNLTQARSETPVLLNHMQSRLAAISGDADRWAHETQHLEAMPLAWAAAMHNGSATGDIAALDAEIAHAKAMVAEALAAPAPQGTPVVRMNGHAAVCRLTEDEAQVRRDDAQRHAEHSRQVAALEREMAGPTAQLEEVRAWVAATASQMDYELKALKAAELGLCPRCVAGQ